MFIFPFPKSIKDSTAADIIQSQTSRLQNENKWSYSLARSFVRSFPLIQVLANFN